MHGGLEARAVSTAAAASALVALLAGCGTDAPDRDGSVPPAADPASMIVQPSSGAEYVRAQRTCLQALAIPPRPSSPLPRFNAPSTAGAIAAFLRRRGLAADPWSHLRRSAYVVVCGTPDARDDPCVTNPPRHRYGSLAPLTRIAVDEHGHQGAYPTGSWRVPHTYVCGSAD